MAILLEELGIDYDAHIVNIGAGEQFSTGFGMCMPLRFPLLLFQFLVRSTIFYWFLYVHDIELPSVVFLNPRA